LSGLSRTSLLQFHKRPCRRAIAISNSWLRRCGLRRPRRASIRIRRDFPPLSRSHTFKGSFRNAGTTSRPVIAAAVRVFRVDVLFIVNESRLHVLQANDTEYEREQCTCPQHAASSRRHAGASPRSAVRIRQSSCCRVTAVLPHVRHGHLRSCSANPSRSTTCQWPRILPSFTS